jgi:hypothetical protein
VDYLPGIDVPQYDPLTNQLYQPALSASQRFAGDRNMQMAALQQLKTASPMSSATYLALQSRLRAGEFGGIGGQPVDMERLKAAATAMVPPVPGLKIGSVSDTAGGSQGSNVPAGFGSGVPVTLGVPTIGRKDGGEVSTEDFIKKQSGGDVSRGTSEVPQLDAEGRLIDEREEIRSESQRMLNRLQSQPSKLPPGLRRIVAATKAQGTESMFPAAAPARDLLSGIIGASPTAPGSEAYRTGQALANMPPVQAAAAIPAKIAASAGDAATALAAMGPAMAGAIRPYGKGTVFSGVKLSNNSDVGSSVDRYINQGKYAAFSTSAVPNRDTTEAIQKFFDTKARRYMSTQLGTERDPVFDAIRKGKISTLALHDQEGLREYAIHAAAGGRPKIDKETGSKVVDAEGRPVLYPSYPQAVIDVTKAYDKMVDVTPMSFKPELVSRASIMETQDPRYQAELERIREQIQQGFQSEGFDPRLVNPTTDPMILTSARDTGKPYYSGYLQNMDDFIAAKLSGDPEAMKNVPENIRRALDQGELLYDVSLNSSPLKDILDPENMARYLATLHPNEIDRIRFEDAVVGSAKFNQAMIDRKFEVQRLKELVKSGKAPDSVFSKGVSKPLLQFGEDQRRPGFAWKRLEDIEATIPEGAYLGHSVGDYVLGGIGYGPEYTKGFLEGTHEIYSLRNARNRPVTTIQVIDKGTKDNPFRVVEQIKGNGVRTGNTAPVDYDEEVYDFLTQVVKPKAIMEKDKFLTPLLIEYRDVLNNSNSVPVID